MNWRIGFPVFLELVLCSGSDYLDLQRQMAVGTPSLPVVAHLQTYWDLMLDAGFHEPYTCVLDTLVPNGGRLIGSSVGTRDPPVCSGAVYILGCSELNPFVLSEPRLGYTPMMLADNAHGYIGAGPESEFALANMPFIIGPNNRIIRGSTRPESFCVPESFVYINRHHDGWIVDGVVSIQEDEYEAPPDSSFETRRNPIPIRLGSGSEYDFLPRSLIDEITAKIVDSGSGVVRDSDNSLIVKFDNCTIERFPTIRYSFFNPSSQDDDPRRPLVVVYMHPEDYVKQSDDNGSSCELMIIPSDVSEEIHLQYLLGANIFKVMSVIFNFDFIGFCDPL